MLSTANIENLKLILNGFQMIPILQERYHYKEPYDEIEIKMWNINGAIAGPWFEEAFYEKHYQEPGGS